VWGLPMELAWLWVAGQVAGWRRLVGFFAGAVRWGVDLKWRGAFRSGRGSISEVGCASLPTRT
jgi:hypothetical protein